MRDRIFKTLALGVLSALLLAAPASAATDGITPLKVIIPDTFEAAAAGTDVFWIAQRKSKPEPKYGYTYTNLLMRSSFADRTKTLVKRFDPEDTTTGFPEKLLAGGGYVFVNMRGEGPERSAAGSSSTVIRLSRDGSNLVKIAYGESDAGEEDSIVVENGKGLLNDCGTAVAAESVTNDGSVVILETKSDRESKTCGRKKNVDHRRYYLLSPSGTAREIAREDVRVTSKIKVFKNGYESRGGPEDPSDWVVHVVGERALLARNHGTAHYVRDLNTGLETGPYKSKLKSLLPFGLGSLDPSGRVAVSSQAVTGDRNHRKVRTSSGVFQAGDPSSFAPAKGLSFLQFCGKHLISYTLRGVRELDPVSLNLVRPISPPHTDGRSVDTKSGCTDDFLYMKNPRGKDASYYAYPLNP